MIGKNRKNAKKKKETRLTVCRNIIILLMLVKGNQLLRMKLLELISIEEDLKIVEKLEKLKNIRMMVSMSRHI